MQQVLADFAAFITENSLWAGPVIGLLVFGESLAVIGMFFPATPIMFAIGGMMGTGTLNSGPIIVWALAGAIVGDWISYAIGRRIGPSVYYRPPFNKHRAMFVKARLFFRRYGFLSIFIGRFLGPVRATVPLVAGVVRMKRQTFQIANILSAMLWVPASFAPGYLAVTSLKVIAVDERMLLAVGGAIALMSIAVTVISARLSSRKRAVRRADMLSQPIP